MNTTANRMNLLLQKRRARLDMRVPVEFKELVVQKAQENDVDYATYVMIAAIEKIDREEVITE